VIVAVVASLLPGYGSTLAATSDADPGFGAGGSTTIDVDGSGRVGGIVHRDDGVLIIASTMRPSYTSFTTIALAGNGELLDTYGTGGVSSVSIPGGDVVTVEDVAIQADGHVVLAGWGRTHEGQSRFVVARFRPGGAADRSFSEDGVALVHFTQGDAFAHGVAVQPNGSIAVVGEVDPRFDVSNPAIARLDPDGSLDRTFGSRGRVVLRIPDGVRGHDSAWNVVAQSRGRLAMVGWTERSVWRTYATLALRLRSNGSLDPSFGDDGIAMIDVDGVDNWAYGLARDGGDLVVGVHTNVPDAAFVRLDENGVPDPTFGNGGVAIHTLSDPWEARAVAVLPDHRVVAVNGYTGGPNLLVLQPRGGLDIGYSSDAEGVGPESRALGRGLVVLNDGTVVVAGTVGGDIVATKFLAP
jgi:uncharacterized delta-60 repeat protein